MFCHTFSFLKKIMPNDVEAHQKTPVGCSVKPLDNEIDDSR